MTDYQYETTPFYLKKDFILSLSAKKRDYLYKKYKYCRNVIREDLFQTLATDSYWKKPVQRYSEGISSASGIQRIKMNCI